jgi:hypothetical protein
VETHGRPVLQNLEAVPIESILVVYLGLIMIIIIKLFIVLFSYFYSRNFDIEIKHLCDLLHCFADYSNDTSLSG